MKIALLQPGIARERVRLRLGQQSGDADQRPLVGAITWGGMAGMEVGISTAGVACCAVRVWYGLMRCGTIMGMAGTQCSVVSQHSNRNRKKGEGEREPE